MNNIVWFIIGFLCGFFLIALSILAYAWYLKRDEFFMGLKMMMHYANKDKDKDKPENPEDDYHGG